MTANTPILLDPFVIDLRTLLRRYLQNLPILLAHELKISAVKTRLAVAHGIDAVILGLYHSHETPKPNATLQQAFGKIITLYSLKKIHAQAVTHDFFASYEDRTIAKLSQTTQLTFAQSSAILGYIAALTKDYLGRIVLFTQLSEREYREWLTLQSLFVSGDAVAWDLPNIPKNSQRSYNDYAQKIGKSVSHRFDSSIIALPNHKWLINLAKAIDEHYRHILTLGKVLALPATPTPKQLNHAQDRTKPNLKNYLSKKHLLIVSASLIVIALSLLIWYLKKPQPPAQTPQTNAPIPQDVAIVRVDDDADDNPNDGNDHKNITNNDKNSPKPQHQNTKKTQPTK